MRLAFLGRGVACREVFLYNSAVRDPAYRSSTSGVRQNARYPHEAQARSGVAESALRYREKGGQAPRRQYSCENSTRCVLGASPPFSLPFSL